MSFFMKGVRIRVAAGCILAILATRGAEARDETNERSEFYLQSSGTSERRVMLELIRPPKSSRLYERISHALKRQGWGVVPKKSGSSIRDRCLIAVSATKTSYELECVIFHEGHVDVLRTEAYGEDYLISVLKIAMELREHPRVPVQVKGRSWM